MEQYRYKLAVKGALHYLDFSDDNPEDLYLEKFMMIKNPPDIDFRTNNKELIYYNFIEYLTYKYFYEYYNGDISFNHTDIDSQDGDTTLVYRLIYKDLYCYLTNSINSMINGEEYNTSKYWLQLQEMEKLGQIIGDDLILLKFYKEYSYDFSLDFNNIYKIVMFLIKSGDESGEDKNVEEYKDMMERYNSYNINIYQPKPSDYIDARKRLKDSIEQLKNL